MQTQYRVDMFPLEPYTFGTEQGSKFEEGTETGKESYIIASGCLPEQTTVLGTLRYLVLREKNLLKADFCYSEEERKKVEEAIGESSFSFLKKEAQNFGVIQKLSPLFLTKHCGEGKEPEIYIKNPFHNKGNAGRFEPMKLTEETLETSYGKIHLPRVMMDENDIRPEYNAKEGYARGYLCLSEDRKATPDDLFSMRLLQGNRVKHKNAGEGFFKREAVVLKKGFAFSVFLEMAEDLFPMEKNAPAQRIAFMGRKKSVFRFRFTKMESPCSLEEMVKSFFRKEENCGESAGCWQYALSDWYLDQPLCYNDFAITAGKSMRTLHTNIYKDSYVGKREKSKHQFYLVESGSVFYGEEKNLKLKEQLENENAKKIGYNAVVSLGGN